MTSAIGKEEGSKIGQNCRLLNSTKKQPILGRGESKIQKIADVVNGWFLRLGTIITSEKDLVGGSRKLPVLRSVLY